MGNNAYCLIVSAAKIRQEDIPVARDKMSSLFQLKDKQLDRLFSGKPLRFMKNIDHTSAQNYCDAILKTGIACQVEDYAPKKEKPASTGNKLSLLRKENTHTEKSYYCPVCHVQQLNQHQCQHCAYDLETYRNTMEAKNYIELEGAGYIPDRRISHRRDNFVVRREMIRIEKFSDRRISEERRRESGVWQGIY